MTYTPPVRTIGDTRVNVREDFGAVGDGAHDDTDAFNKAFASLMNGGGEVHVPPGNYGIDVTRSIRPVNNSRLRLDAGANLRPLPCTLQRAYLLRIQDIHDFELIGGQLIGDKDGFTITSTPGNTYEWRHGIACYNSQHITIRDVVLDRWVGDGLSIGGSAPCNDVALFNVTSTNNRRQGTSIVNCTKFYAYNCVFAFTKGTSPECGVDVEPEKGNVCDDITFDSCAMTDNNMYGIELLRRAGCGPVTNVKIINCIVERNSNGVYAENVANVDIEGGLIDHNRATGIVISYYTDHIRVSGVTFERNYTKLADRPRTTAVITGWKAALDRDILMRKSTTTPAMNPTNIDIATNTYK